MLPMTALFAGKLVLSLVYFKLKMSKNFGEVTRHRNIMQSSLLLHLIHLHVSISNTGSGAANIALMSANIALDAAFSASIVIC